jgi:hypothetical protein
MGLLYVFPVSEEETDFVKKDNEALTLKTYGLPYIFWIYALCTIAVIFFMFLAIKEPILKLIAVGDEVDATLGKILLSLIGLVPLGILSFFFYEKRIVRKKDEIDLIHKVFGITVFSEKFYVENSDSFTIDSFLDSPNVARMKASDSNVGFQNKGYFVLWLKDKNGKKIQIDRHSRKADLEKLRSLLTRGLI